MCATFIFAGWIVADIFAFSTVKLIVDHSDKYFAQNRTLYEFAATLEERLQSDMSLYAMMRYEEELESICWLLDELSSSFLRLDDRQLKDASNDDANPIVTRTDSAMNWVGAIERTLPRIAMAPHNRNLAEQKIRLLRTQLTKEAAEQRLAARANENKTSEGPDAPSERDAFRRKLLYLKEKGIDDPSLELFLVVTADRETPEGMEQLQAALAAGADVTMTDVALLQKYHEELKDFAL